MCSDLCEDEEFRNHLLELKHKHDIIMKSQLKHKTSLCRRTSSTGSRGYILTPAGHSHTAQTRTSLKILTPAGYSYESHATHISKTMLTPAGRSHSLHANDPYSSYYNYIIAIQLIVYMNLYNKKCLCLCVRSKVVRRASLSDRHNLCRKEYQTEAIVWRGREEQDSEQENSQYTVGRKPA